MLFLVNRMALRIWLENEQLVFFIRKRLKNNCAVLDYLKNFGLNFRNKIFDDFRNKFIKG